MATQSPLKEDQAEEVEAIDAGRKRRAGLPRPRIPRPPVGQILRDLNWMLLLLFGIGGGAFWTLLLSQQSALTFLAGLLPVLGGIIVGRRIKQHVGWHAGMLSVITVLAALVTAGLLASTGLAQSPLFQQTVLVGLITLVPFPAFGVITANRTEERNSQLRIEQERRGGKLEKPGRVKSIDELRSLSLPQLGGYVADLFRRHDFKVHDFHFERDNSVEFEMTHDEEPWLIRVTVDDKIKQGSVLQFVQRLRNDPGTKGVFITSMDFQDSAARWAKDKPVALVDGPTLLSMND
jgi:hypothetical protein